MHCGLRTIVVAAGLAATALGGCAGLQQLPESTTDYAQALKELDSGYATVIAELTTASSDDERRAIRNKLIAERVRVTDLRFKAFAEDIVKDSVALDFGTNVLNIGVGTVGAFASETTSQILSAINAGLTGSKEAYDKVAFFDQTMMAMVAQMIATRQEVRVRLLTGMRKNIQDYSIVQAVQDLDDYQYAGSIPGAISATAKDAQEKEQKAQAAAATLSSPFHKDSAGDLIEAFWKPDGEFDEENQKAIEAFLTKNGAEGEPIQYFIRSTQYADLRNKFVEEFGLNK